MKKKEKKKKKGKTTTGETLADNIAGATGAEAAVAESTPKGPTTKVHVEGMNVTPLKDFSGVDMPPEVMRYVTLREWRQPTQIQGYCWPVLNAGRDVVGIAETGSGKTLAFSLPAITRILERTKVMVIYNLSG